MCGPKLIDCSTLTRVGMSNRELKERLFVRGADALRRVARGDGTTYACPTCLRLMTRADIESGDLTLEHVPPESLGGRGIALTCRACNSTAGHTVDAAAHERHRLFELGKGLAGRGGEFAGSVKLQIGGVATNAELRLQDSQAILKIHENSNHPQRFADQTQALARAAEMGRPEDLRLHVTAKLPFKFERARISDLRAAFIAAFAQFGYRYAVHPRLAGIRKQVLDPDTPIIDGAWWIAGPEFTEDPMMFLLHRPLEGVLIRLRQVLVILPWPSSGDDFYLQVRREFGAGTVELSGDILVWPRSLELVYDFR